MTTASAQWIDSERFIGTATSGHAIVVDSGEKKTGNGPMELVLIALCSCTATDVVSILRKKREPFTTVVVRAEGERAKDPPTVYTKIHLIYEIGGKVSHTAAEHAVHLSKEKYCGVSHMVAKTAEITFEIRYME